MSNNAGTSDSGYFILDTIICNFCVSSCLTELLAFSVKMRKGDVSSKRLNLISGNFWI